MISPLSALNDNLILIFDKKPSIIAIRKSILGYELWFKSCVWTLTSRSLVNYMIDKEESYTVLPAIDFSLKYGEPL